MTQADEARALKDASAFLAQVPHLAHCAVQFAAKNQVVKCTCHRAARAMLAFRAEALPDGWVMVRREVVEPFAAFADALNEAVPDNIALGIFADGGMRFGPSSTTVGSLRALREALSAAPGDTTAQADAGEPKAVRACKACGAGPREWMECEDPDCDIETQEEADARSPSPDRLAQAVRASGGRRASDCRPGTAIWVVEWQDEGRLFYVCLRNHVSGFTDKFAEALDFGSRENAEQFHRLWMAGYPGSRVADHEWVTP